MKMRRRLTHTHTKKRNTNNSRYTHTHTRQNRHILICHTEVIKCTLTACCAKWINASGPVVAATAAVAVAVDGDDCTRGRKRIEIEQIKWVDVGLRSEDRERKRAPVQALARAHHKCCVCISNGVSLSLSFSIRAYVCLWSFVVVIKNFFVRHYRIVKEQHHFLSIRCVFYLQMHMMHHITLGANDGLVDIHFFPCMHDSDSTRMKWNFINSNRYNEQKKRVERNYSVHSDNSYYHNMYAYEWRMQYLDSLSNA